MQQNRYVCLDTETTGLRVTAGSRMIEIGMVEVIDGKITNRQYQSHLKCNEKLSDVVKKISNITDEMLIGKPDFSEIANDVMNFLNKDANGNESKATLVIHNAKFDLSFLNFQLQESINTDLKDFAVIDTIHLIRNHIPGAKLNLDSVAKRYDIDLSEREQGHGALIDSKILAKVFLALLKDGANPDDVFNQEAKDAIIAKRSVNLEKRIFTISEQDEASHRDLLAKIGSEVW
jgi:DNA polymerase-3 subunit epsilon